MSTNAIKKALIIILDGLGDRPIAEFSRQTPLEKAHTPFFDQLATQGLCAMVHPLTPGIPVSTHTGMALLMGLIPKAAMSLARGPVEAAGINLVSCQGDIILRCNFAHLVADKKGLKVLDRRAGRVNRDTKSLAQALQDIKLPYGIKAGFYPTTQHRAVLHLQGDNLSSQITDTDCSRLSPAYVQTSKALSNNRAAQQTAEAVNSFIQQAYHILSSHPVNLQRIKQGKVPATGIVCRSAGQINSLHNIVNYYQLKTAVIAAEATVTGLSKLFGFTTINHPSFTAMADTNIEKKISLAMAAMQDHDLVYIHIKGTDICGHDHQAAEKKEFIERIDRAFSTIDITDKIIAISADHSTDTTTGFHSGDPVPSLIYSAHGRYDKCRAYSEQECLYGGLGHLSSSSFLLTILDQMGRVHNFKKEDTDYISLFT